MSQELNKFFALITADEALQEQLFNTTEIADVAVIARKLGFNIVGADILRAQAGRVLSSLPIELEEVAAGRRGKTVAQWGRAGRGYLDNAGFWVTQFIIWNYFDSTSDSPLGAFLIKVKEDPKLQTQLLENKTFNEISKLANTLGYSVSGIALLRYQATQILKLNDEQAEKIAYGYCEI